LEKNSAPKTPVHSANLQFTGAEKYYLLAGKSRKIQNFRKKDHGNSTST
jgi:hypothetical protein